MKKQPFCVPPIKEYPDRPECVPGIRRAPSCGVHLTQAQPKAAEIAHAVGVIAEVDMSRIQTRLDQGWCSECYDSLDEVFASAKKHLAAKTATSIAYHGNIVDLLEYVVKNHIHVDLMSDQTSCHAAYEGGYCPQGLAHEDARRGSRTVHLAGQSEPAPSV